MTNKPELSYFHKERERPTGRSLLNKTNNDMNLKDKIIIEAMKLFSLNGYLSTSMKDIIQAAHTSKGGIYNHFTSKEELFYHVLEEARKIWRDKNLHGIQENTSPVDKIKILLENFRDRYLKDSDDFPGGCIFITLSVSLSDKHPHLSQEINKGFVSLKAMIKRWLNQGKARGELKEDVKTEAAVEVIFTGMLGATVVYGLDKSSSNLDGSITCLIEYLENLRS